MHPNEKDKQTKLINKTKKNNYVNLPAQCIQINSVKPRKNSQ